MGRRGRDKETGREVRRCSVVREAVAADWMVPHSHMVDKNWEGYLGSEGAQPRPDHIAQFSSARKINPHNF